MILENLLDMCVGHEGDAFDKWYGLNIRLHSHLCAEVLTLTVVGLWEVIRFGQGHEGGAPVRRLVSL